MESLFSTFLLFLAALTALITYVVVPRIPMIVLAAVAAVLLTGAVWWHWTQFAVEYRTSTWQDQIRNYGSYFIVLAVILLSYLFYAFISSGGSVQTLTKGATNITSVVTSRASNLTNTVFRGEEAEEELPELEEVEPAPNTNSLLNIGRNLMNFGAPVPNQNLNRRNNVNRPAANFLA